MGKPRGRKYQMECGNLEQCPTVPLFVLTLNRPPSTRSQVSWHISASLPPRFLTQGLDFPDLSTVTTSAVSPGTSHRTCLFYGFLETDFSKLNLIYCLWSKYPISIRNLAYIQTCMLPSISYFKYTCLTTMKQTWYLEVFNERCNKTFCSGFLLFSTFQMTFHGGLFQEIFKYIFHSLV